MIQPIVVRPHGHRFQIVAGERRWRAAQRARLHEIPAIVRDLSDAETLEVALIENIQRQDLNAIEEAQAYQRLIDDYGHTQEALGKLVHKSRSHVANLLRLLDLPAKVQALVGDRAAQHGPCPRADHRAGSGRRWPTRSSAAACRCARPRSWPQPASRAASASLPIEYKGAGADIAALERQLGDLLGLKVTIRHSPQRRAGDAGLFQPRPARHDLPAAERREVLAAAGRAGHASQLKRRPLTQPRRLAADREQFLVRRQRPEPARRLHLPLRLEQPADRLGEQVRAPATQLPADRIFLLPEQGLAG